MVCSQKCHWRIHANFDCRYEVEERVVTKTCDDMKARYEDALQRKQTKKAAIKALSDDFMKVKKDVAAMIDEVRNLNARLSNPLTIVEYIGIYKYIHKGCLCQMIL